MNLPLGQENELRSMQTQRNQIKAYPQIIIDPIIQRKASIQSPRQLTDREHSENINEQFMNKTQINQDSSMNNLSQVQTIGFDESQKAIAAHTVRLTVTPQNVSIGEINMQPVKVVSNVKAQAQKQPQRTIKDYSQRRYKMKTIGSQSNDVKVVKGKVFQINIKDDLNAGYPAVVRRESLSPKDGRVGMISSSQSYRKRVKTICFNDTLQLQSQKVIDNQFSHSQLRKSMRDAAISQLNTKKILTNQSSPRLGLSQPTSPREEEQSDPKKRYNRTLMTQRFSNKGISSQIVGKTLRQSDSQKDENFLPKLKKQSLAMKKKENQSANIKNYDEHYQKAITNIFVHELKAQRGISSGGLSQPRLVGMVSFDEREKLNSQISQIQRKEIARVPLIDFNEYEVLSNDQYFSQNIYNIVQTSPSNTDRQNDRPSKAMFKIVSSGNKTSRRNRDDDSSDQSTGYQQKTSHIMSSVKSSDDESHYYHDGKIKNNTHSYDDELDGYREFVTLSDYFHRVTELKHRYSDRKKSKKYMKRIKPDEYIILNRIYPMIYSIKNRLKGTVEQPDVEFNPSHMTQYEIFLIKAVTYLHTHQYDKANYFLNQGITAWPTQSFEFKFNLGLLHYLKGEYHESVSVYRRILENVEQDQVELEQKTYRSLAIYMNLILSLIREGGKYGEVLDLQDTVLFKRIRMLTHQTNLKIQQVLNYITIQHGRSHKRLSSLHLADEALGSELGYQNTFSTRTADQSPTSAISHIDGRQGGTEDSSQSNVLQFGQRKGSTSQREVQSPRTLINYKRFKKRGGHDFPLKNIQQLKNIRLQKIAMRQQQKMKLPDSLSQSPVVQSDQNQRQGISSPKNQFHNIMKSNKVKFFNIENIQDTRSPDYVMSMTDIISRLTQKEDIQQNKTLMYQLQQLDDVVKQDRRGSAERKDQGIMPFPYEQNKLQKSEHVYSEDGFTYEKDENNEKLLEQCMRNLEELRLEVNKEYGGDLESVDPVLVQYKIICNSIYSLLKEESLLDILKSGTRKNLTRQQRAAEARKMSVAKEILLSALLRRNSSNLTIDNQASDQFVEIELLKEKVGQLKDIMMTEINSKQDKQGMDYMEKVEKEIKKMLVIARKKQKERQRQIKQEFEDLQMTINPLATDKLSDEVLIATKSLISILKRQRFQETVSDRFKVDKKKYLESLVSKQDALMSNKKKSTGSLTQEVLKKFQPVDPDQYTKMLERTTTFLNYLSDTYGAFFIAQQTYCMTELLEDSPDNIKSYFQHTSSILTTIPMKLQNLTDSHDDNQWQQINKSEFFYNRDDLIHRLVSEGLRHPKYLEYLGLEKHEWIIEVTQKFNMLAILNSIFREGIKVFSNHETTFDKGTHQSEDQEDPDQILNKTDHQCELEPIESFVDNQSLNAIKDQFARLKYKGSAFNTELIDKLLSRDIPMFKQFNEDIRRKIYRLSHLRTIMVNEQTEVIVDIDKMSRDSTIVFLSGNIFIQFEQMSEQKLVKVERYEKKKKIEEWISPGPPIMQWITKHVLGPGMAVPVESLYRMKNKHKSFRLLAQNQASLLNGSIQSIDYLEFNNKDLSQLVFTPVISSILKKVQLIQNVDLLCGNSAIGQERIETLSPYAMFVLAALCKVQVFNMSELIIAQDEIPQSMFVILEGQAKVVYEDKLSRKGEVCPYSRRSIRTDIPKDLKFGLKSFQTLQEVPVKKQKKSLTRKVSKESLSNVNLDLQQIDEEDEFKKEAGYLQGQNGKFARQSITYQNLVYNQKWTEHQPTKKLTFKHHIEFGLLTEGQYLASRVVLDEGAIKNFIKTSKDKIKEWQKAPKHGLRKSITQTLKNGFIQTLGEGNKEQVKTKEKKESDESDPESIIDEQLLQSEWDETISPFTPKGFIQSQSVNSINTPTAKFIGSKQYPDDKDEIQALKVFLMKSQLSIVVVSSTLKAMVLYKQDKSYFNEPVKKLLTEMIQDKNFIDLDRPLQQAKQLDFIRSTQKQWEQYKQTYEVHSLRESFHQKYEKYPR